MINKVAALCLYLLGFSVFGIYTIGGVCASLPGSYLPDKVGRRWTMVIGNTVLV